MTPGILISIRSSAKRTRRFNAGGISSVDRLLSTCRDHTIPEDKLRELQELICPILDEYAELERQINIPTGCRINLGNLKASNSNDGIIASEELRCSLGAQSLPFAALLPKLERGNVRIIPVDGLPPIILTDGIEKTRNAFAFYDRLYDNAVICVNRNSPPSDQLYEIAYELGSYLRCRHFTELGTNPVRREDWFCRAFASTLLMPESEIREIIDELNIGSDDWSLRLLDDLALHFGVSSRAFVWRIRSLRRIDKDIFMSIDDRLRNPEKTAAANDLNQRPPLKFNTWLTTLRRRTDLKL